MKDDKKAEAPPKPSKGDGKTKPARPKPAKTEAKAEAKTEAKLENSPAKPEAKHMKIKIKKPSKGEASKAESSKQNKSDVSKVSKPENTSVSKPNRDEGAPSGRPSKVDAAAISKIVDQSKRGIRFFISGCNSLLGYCLIEELRNDHIEDEDEGKANLFIGSLNKFDPVNPPPSNLKRVVSGNSKSTIDKILQDADVMLYNIRTDSIDEIRFVAQSK